MESPSPLYFQEEGRMAEKFEITTEMEAAIGVESAPWHYEVTTTSVRGFARGVGSRSKLMRAAQ